MAEDTVELDAYDGTVVEVPESDVWEALDVDFKPGVYMANATGEMAKLHDEAGDGDIAQLTGYVNEHIDGVEMRGCVEDATVNAGPLSLPTSPPTWAWVAVAFLPFFMIATGSPFVAINAAIGSLALGIALGETLVEDRCNG